jgi:acyl-CoA synthetase (AMP-forming)/AMP-acid ligase II
MIKVTIPFLPAGIRLNLAAVGMTTEAVSTALHSVQHASVWLSDCLASPSHYLNGWTPLAGELVPMERDGFITIVDPLFRFSKIGSEMVPHVRIEDKLHELAGVQEQVFSVTAVPDEKKGEHIVFVHTLPEDKLTRVLEELAQCRSCPRPGSRARIRSLT